MLAELSNLHGVVIGGVTVVAAVAIPAALAGLLRFTYSSRLTPEQRSVEQYARTCRASDPVSGVRAKEETR